MNKEIRIGRLCKCIRGGKGNWTKGRDYLVHSLYQDEDGDFMVKVGTNYGEHENASAFANRFEINFVMPSA